MLKKAISLEQLIGALSEQYRVLGNKKRWVRSVYPIKQSEEDSLCFCVLKDERAFELIRNSRSGVIICSDKLNFPEETYSDKTLIQVSNPRLTFSRLLRSYFFDKPQSGIHPTAIVDKRAKIGDRVCIGPLCNIENCEIGNDTILESGVHMLSKVKIGKRVRILPGAVIGPESQGYERNEKMELERFPQLGGVVIEDDVWIGTNSIICRGALPRSDTTIGKGTSIGAMVTVAHGVKIGNHCIIIAGCNILGSVQIGDYTHISANVSIKQGVKIGNRVLVGLSSAVLSDIPDNVVVVGIPAKKIRDNIIVS